MGARCSHLSVLSTKVSINLKNATNKVLAQKKAEVERIRIVWFKESQITKLQINSLVLMLEATQPKARLHLKINQI